MNLAQSVSICLYETARVHAAACGKTVGGKKLASIEVLEGMYRHMRSTLTRIGFLDPQNPDHILRSFRRIFGRSGLNEREVRILRGLWSRLDWLNGQREEQ
jgi:tRNA/rRNA methyltransferase